MTALPWKAGTSPAKGRESDKLVIFNHALPMCRAGFPGHLGEPWSNFDAVEIDFVVQMKHLTDAGYNVLAYDIRNHGNSGAAVAAPPTAASAGSTGGSGGTAWGQEVRGRPLRRDEGRAVQPVHGRELAVR